MTSLWSDPNRTIATDPFAADACYDDVVVGAGLTGLVTALLFARRGHTVAVLEARTVGSLATGNSAAMVSLLQGARLQTIRRRSYQAIVDAYVAGSRQAFDWLVDYAAAAGLEVEWRDAYSYATTRVGLARVDAEYQIGRAAGLDLAKTVDVDVPFATIGAVRLRDQAQLDPMQLVAALVTEIRALGGVVIENMPVIGVEAKDPALTHTAAGTLRSARVHLTTGTPILDRGLYFAKVSPRRSFGLAFDGIADEQLPSAMYSSVEGPSRVIRRARGQLLISGNEHGVGRASSEAVLADELTAWTIDQWPGARRSALWSGQDYATPHGVPFVGYLPRGRGRIYLATGYDSWGMTNAVSAARMLVADVLGDPAPWMTTLHHRLTTPVAVGAGIGENAAVAWWFAKNWTRALTNPLPAGEVPPEGRGRVGREGFAPMARSTVGGRTCSLSAICPHLGGVVTWNDQESSWDCPLHGSRFRPDGERIEGPASRGLSARPR